MIRIHNEHTLQVRNVLFSLQLPISDGYAENSPKVWHDTFLTFVLDQYHLPSLASINFKRWTATASIGPIFVIECSDTGIGHGSTLSV